MGAEPGVPSTRFRDSKPLLRLRRFSRVTGPWFVLAIGLVGIPLLHTAGVISTARLNELGYYLALAIVAVGLDLVWGFSGVLCLCMALFFGMGVYAMAMHLALHGSMEGGIPRSLHEVTSAVETPELPWHWVPFESLPVTLLLGLALPGLVAFVIGYFGFRSRVRGVYFAVLTQAMALAGWVTFRNTEIKLGGTTGIRNFLTLGGFELGNDSTLVGLYVLTVVMLIGVLVLCRCVVRSRLGRVLVAIRDNEDRLRFSGYKSYWFKLSAFVLAAMIAGLGGMLYTPQKGSINPAMITVEKSILIVIWVAVGGRGTLTGAVLGAMLIQVLENLLTSPHDFYFFAWKGEYWQYVLGTLFIGVVLLFPDGLMSLWHRWTRAGPRPEDPDEEPTRDSVEPAELQQRLASLALRQRNEPSETQLDSSLLTVENIQVHFDGFRALDVEQYSVPHYDLNVIIGPNGAGKTTLCDVISGKTKPSQGHVHFAGREITSLAEVEIARMGVGRKFQTPTIFDSLTVFENMELALPERQTFIRNFNRHATATERDQIESILERVRLVAVAGRPARFLSHGQRQWLEISMLVLSKPRLLLVDEPAAGLTDEETVLTAELLLELQDQHSIIVIEHDMEFVRLLNSRVTVLNEGRIIAQGPMSEIQENPEVIEAYLGR